MTQRFVQRYFSALNHYKWLGLASFAACVGVSGAIALRLGLPPTYKAEAVLMYNNNTPFLNCIGKLMAAYNGRCAISGCDIPQALEAVQINTEGDRSNRLSNWLLLRADLKKLFDTHQLVIEPTTMTVLIDPSLADTKYAELAGRPVYLPDDEASRPSIKALKSHFSQHGWTNHINFG